MNEKSTDTPLYLLIASWAMEEKRWVSAKEIADKFDIPRCNAINIVSYILSSIKEIKCETKTIPNQLEGRGCQCQRMIKVIHIDQQHHSRLNSHKSGKTTQEQLVALSSGKLSCEQKWQQIMSKSQRR